FERAEDVPQDLAMTLAVNVDGSFLELPLDKAMLIVFGMVPWVARADPEALYLPRDAVRVLRTPWTPEATCRRLRPLRDHYRPAPGAKPDGPARKGPCPCGSGKKYKRCCGAELPA